MEKIHKYETSVSGRGQNGVQIEAAGLPTLATAPPPEFGGPGGKWSPEHLFVSSANVCVMLNFVAMAKFSNLEVGGWRSTAKGTVEKVEGQGWVFTGIDIEAELEVPNPSEAERVHRLAEKAEKNCLISKSMKTPVRFEVKMKAPAA